MGSQSIQKELQYKYVLPTCSPEKNEIGKERKATSKLNFKSLGFLSKPNCLFPCSLFALCFKTQLHWDPQLGISSQSPFCVLLVLLELNSLLILASVCTRKQSGNKSFLLCSLVCVFVVP